MICQSHSNNHSSNNNNYYCFILFLSLIFIHSFIYICLIVYFLFKNKQKFNQIIEVYQTQQVRVDFFHLKLLKELPIYRRAIDVNYRPLLPLERLQPDESYTDYYQRSFNVAKYFTNIHQNEGANILVVGHAGTLEVCTRQISGYPVRPYIEFNATIRKVPYLGISLLEKEAQSHMFEIQQPVITPISHTSNFNFDPLNLKI